MGFFDRFTRTLSDWDFRWAEAGKNLSSSWQATRDSVLQSHAMGTNLWMTAFGGEDAKENTDAYWAAKGFWERTFDLTGTVGAGVGGVFGALGEMPALRQAFALFDAAQHDLFSRPIATASLVRADAMNEGSLGVPLDAAKWREAYNTTSYVTPGQAFLYSAISNAQGFAGMFGQELSEIQRRDIMRDNPTLGIIAQNPKEFDPRNRGEGRDAYYENTFMKGLSGTLDAGFVILADPTIVAGKGLGALKLRYVSREMNAAAINAGRLETHIDSKSYQKAKEFIQNAETSEDVWRRMFANHYEGDFAAAILFDAAKMQPNYERLGGTVDLFDTTYRALYGDVRAWDTLTVEAAHYADAIGHKRANYTIANEARNFGTGDPAVDTRVNKLTEDKFEAWVDATLQGHGVWGRLGEGVLGGGALTGTTVPRLTATSAWRTGVHSFMRNSVPTTLGHWARRASYVLPSQRTGRMLDLNDPNSHSVFRSRLELSRLEQSEIDRWMSMYVRQTSPEGRFNVYNLVENFVMAKYAERYGITTKQINDMLPVMNRYRKGNRQILGSNRRFASEDVAKAYEKRLRTMKQPGAKRIAMAQEIIAARDKIDQAVKNGETPQHFYTLPDEQGMLTLVPEDMNLRLDKPITQAQHADMVPMVDWNVLENALWWHVGFGRGRPATKAGQPATWSATVGKHIYGAQDFSRALLEAVMSVWKVTAILRPGYIWRTLSDEIGRIMVVQKQFPNLASMGRAPGNVKANMWARGRLLGEIAGERRAKALAGNRRIEVDGEVVAVGARVDLPQNVRMSEDARLDPSNPASMIDGDLVYSSWEHALADGVVGPDDFINQVELQGTSGSLPDELATIWDPYAKGIKGRKEFRRQVVDYALRKTGRGAYVSPAWQQMFLRHMMRRHENKPPGQVGEPTVIDPLAGDSPDITTQQMRDGFTINSRREIGADAEGVFNHNDVYDYIADNLEELSKPNNLLHSYVTPEGRISLAVGTATDASTPLKRTGGTRVRLPWGKDRRQGDLYRDSGTADIFVNTPAGKVGIHGAFIGGDGDRFRKQVSNRGPQDAWVDAATDIEHARWMADAGRWVDVGPDDWATYGESWQRAVNLHLGKDEVARQFLSGRTYDDVISWMQNTDRGRAYHWRMGPWRSMYSEHVAMIQSMVDTYLPVGNNQAKAPPAALLPRELDTPEIARIKTEVQQGKGIEEAAGRTLSPDELRILDEGIKGNKTAKSMRMELGKLGQGTPSPVQPFQQGLSQAFKGAKFRTDLPSATDLDGMRQRIAAGERIEDVVPDFWTPNAINELREGIAQGRSTNSIRSAVANVLVKETTGPVQGMVNPAPGQQATPAATAPAPKAPKAPTGPDPALELRRKVLAGEATISDLEKVVRRDQMPRVHGATIEFATGRGPIMDAVKRWTDKTFKLLSDLPNDKLARFPFAAERYNTHVKELAKARGGQLARADQTFSVKDVEAIERIARNRALRDVQRYLFHTNASWDMAKSLRLFVPFGSALADSFLKWGLVLRENPTSMLNIWKIWNAPDRNGLVTDQDGNQLAVEEGKEVWYQVHPETGERTPLPEDHRPRDRFVTFRLPSWLSEKHFGEDSQPQVRINKLVFQTFLDVPTAGPIVAVPASRFSLDNPEFADNKFVKQWILPNGPSADQSAIFIPSNLRNLRQKVFPQWAKADRDQAEAQTISIFASEMANYSMGQRQEPPTFEEAREKAAAMRGLRFWAAQMGVSPQIQSPYQPYIDYYRQLRLQEAELRQTAVAEGRDIGEVPSADELFYREMGDEFFALTMAVTRNALGIPATVETNKAWRKYQDLMERHPDVATLILGSEGAGEFSRAVYEAQKIREVRPGSGDKQRERFSAEESWEDMQTRRGWIEYGKFMDLIHVEMANQGLTSLQQTAAARLKEARDTFLAERMLVDSPWGDQVINPWFREFHSIDRSRMSSRLHSMREIAQDPRLQGRDDIRGMIDYLTLRERYRRHMAMLNYASLDTEQAAGLKAEWMRIVFMLKNDNLAFASLYDRWLTADENLEAS